MYSVHDDVPVLVAGGGLVGLTVALALQHHGVRCLVVERHAGTSVQPKARRFNFRTMEVFRDLGISGEVMAAAAGLADYQAMRAGRTLVESRLLPPPPGVVYEELPAVSPEESCLVAQDVLEPVLLGVARERGVDVRFRTELVGLERDGEGLTVTLRDTADGARQTVRARYLVGADGSRSTVRDLVGVARTGSGSLRRHVTVYFDADLEDVVRDRRFNLCQVDHVEAPGALASVDGRRRWLFLTRELFPVPEDDRSLDAECAHLWAGAVRRAIGVEQVDVLVRSVQAWESAAWVADRFVVKGRVLLAGDAAHVMPPYAALGANTGIQDAHNLAWKVAAVLAGWAGPGLVETYHAERHPAASFAVEQSALRGGGLREQAGERPREQAHPFALVAGFQYRDGAVVDDGGDEAPLDRLELCGRPGTRLPHAWLERPGRSPARISTLDLAGLELALLTGPGGDEWVSAARGADLGVPLRAYAVGSEAVDPTGGWAAAVGIEHGGALLVRPDAVVAWRSAGRVEDPAAVLRSAVGRVLHPPRPFRPGWRSS